jgi:hypothetical protein
MTKSVERLQRRLLAMFFHPDFHIGLESLRRDEASGPKGVDEGAVMAPQIGVHELTSLGEHLSFFGRQWHSLPPVKVGMGRW